MIAVVVVIGWLIGSGDSSDLSSAEEVAKSFVEYMLVSNKGEKAAGLVSDVTVRNSGYATRKIFENEFKNTVEKATSSSKTKYKKVEVIDSYYVDTSDIAEKYGNATICEVALELSYVKEKLLSDEKGKESKTITLILEDNQWKVLTF